MCCPLPFPPRTIFITYFLLTIIFSFILNTKSSVLLSPSNVELEWVQDCPGFENKKIDFNLYTKRINETAQMLHGNITLGYDLDESIKITLKGINQDGDGADSWPKRKTYIHSKSICRILDNYAFEYTDISSRLAGAADSLCPIRAGYYEFFEGPLIYGQINLPFEMMYHKLFVVELTKDNELITCKEFQIENV